MTAPLLSVAYAYSPREGAIGLGAYHLVTSSDVRAGRLRRLARDPLCRPRHAFHFLDARPGNTPSCSRCLEIAARQGWTVEVSPAALRDVLSRWVDSPRPQLRAKAAQLKAICREVSE